MTEGEIRRQAKDYLSRQAQRGREEMGRVLTTEIKRVLGHADLHEIVRRALHGLTVEVQAKIRIHGSDDHSKSRSRRRG